jgi:hypothetical protein
LNILSASQYGLGSSRYHVFAPGFLCDISMIPLTALFYYGVLGCLLYRNARLEGIRLCVDRARGRKSHEVIRSGKGGPPKPSKSNERREDVR